jgi:hypothetical protein
MSVNDRQVGGNHYQSRYQHWDYIAEAFGTDYFKGVITKYLVRWRRKNGVEDLEKALHYTEKLKELVEAGAVLNKPRAPVIVFAVANELDVSDSEAVHRVVMSCDLYDLCFAVDFIKGMLNDAKSK